MKLLFLLLIVFTCLHLTWTFGAQKAHRKRTRAAAAAVTTTPAAVHHRMVHPRFRPGVRAERKRRVRTTTTTKAMKLLARNHVQPVTPVSELDAHYQQQIHAFFQRQHHHEHPHPPTMRPARTRSRVKTGLK